jgi:spermidine synthase
MTSGALMRPVSPRALIVCVSLSGGATLAAESMGARLLRPLVGSTAFSHAGTLAGILGALGLGAWLAGQYIATGKAKPSRVFVSVHAALAVYTVIALGVATWCSLPLARWFVNTHAYGDVFRLGFVLISTAVPGVLAGAVYPSSVAMLGRGAGAGTGIIGAASSLGAAMASMIVAFGLGATLGVRITLMVVAGVYALLALVASQWRVEDSPTTMSVESTHPRQWDVVVAMAFLGVVSTAWQTLLLRVGALSFGPSALTFAAVLAAHVTSLGAGEAWTARRAQTLSPGDARGALARTLLYTAFATIVGAAMLGWVPSLAWSVLRDGSPSRGLLWLYATGAFVLASLPVVAFAGSALCLAARSLEHTTTHGGSANGAALGAMAVGNVVGALVVPFVVMPRLGIGIAPLAVGACAVAALMVLRAFPSAALAGLVLTISGIRTVQNYHPEPMLRGPFLYAGRETVELGRIAWTRDEAEATVTVRNDDEGNVLLQIDGKVDATSLGDAVTQTVVGMVPVLLARETNRVLVIGVGSGMTVDAARGVPGVREVEAVELLDSVVHAARHDFARANHHVLEDPRVRVIHADASHYLRGTHHTYDAIVSEPSNPWVAGMSDLFTRETFEAARAHLNPGGTFGQWFHAYSTRAETVSSILETFRTVFPKSTVFEVTPGQDYLMVGLRDGAIDLDRVVHRMNDTTVARALAAASIASPAALLTRFVSGTHGTALLGANAPILRAGELSLEFGAPTALYLDQTADIFALLARVDDLPLAGMVQHTEAGSTWLRLLDESSDRREAVTHLRAMVLADRQGDPVRALREGELAVGYDTQDLTARTLLARLYISRAVARRRARDPGGAEHDLTSALELAPPPAERLRILVRLGDFALQRRDAQRALTRYTEALSVSQQAGAPASELYARQAEALAAMNAPQQAAEALSHAVATASSSDRRSELEALRRGIASPRQNVQESHSPP